MAITINQLLNSRASKEIFSVKPDQFVIDAIKSMNELKVGALAVLENNQLVGIISERDYARKIVLHDRLSSQTQVREIMTTDVLTVNPSQTVDECLVVMSNNHIRHLPIVANDELVGMVSIMDIVKHIISEKELIIKQLENYITDKT